MGVVTGLPEVSPTTSVRMLFTLYIEIYSESKSFNFLIETVVVNATTIIKFNTNTKVKVDQTIFLFIFKSLQITFRCLSEKLFHLL